MRLIDADKFCEHCEDFPQCKGMYKAECGAYVMVADSPTINPESLRPKGEWLQSEGGIVYCKNCGATVKVGDESALKDAREIEHFCYNCGADMRGTENER